MKIREAQETHYVCHTGVWDERTSPQASSLGSETEEGRVAVMTWIDVTDLKVQHKCVPCKKEEISPLLLTAIDNSWIHLRRKKRDRVRQLRGSPSSQERH